jgi:hypothetical protein
MVLAVDMVDSRTIWFRSTPSTGSTIAATGSEPE